MDYQESFEGISNLDKVVADMRIYGKTQDILKITKGRLNMMRVMAEHFPSPMAVNEFHIKYMSDYPLQATFAIGEASGAVDGGTENKIGVPIKEAVLLTEGTRLFAVNYFYNGNAAGTGAFSEGTAGIPSDVTNSQRECLKILSKLEKTSTFQYFKVERGYQPSGSNSSAGRSYADGGGGTPGELASGATFLISLVPQAIGDNTGGIFGDSPHIEEAFCEIVLQKVGTARSAERVKTWQGESMLQRNTSRQVDLFWKKQELKSIFGRAKDGMYNISPVDGSPIYEAGGIDEYIRTAQPKIGYYPIPASNSDPSGHIVNFALAHGAVNYQNLNTFGKDKFFYGSQVKWWFMDDEPWTKITNSFDPKVRISYNENLSLRYGFKISELEISGGGIFRMATSDMFSIYGLKNHSFIVDFDYFKPFVLEGEDFTMYIDVEKGMNILKRIDYLYMNRGYKRSNPFAHYVVYNF